MTTNSLKVLLIILLIPLVMISQSFAQDSEASFSYNRDLRSYEVYDSRNYMTGNWGGFRSRLNELGITPL